MASEASESGTKDDDLESMMNELGLGEEDLDDVVLEEVMEFPQEATRGMAVARVHT